MKAAIGLFKKTDIGLIVEVKFEGTYEQGNPTALKEICGELEKAMGERNISGIILNLLDFDYIYGDDLDTLIETAVRIEDSRKKRSCVVVAEGRKVARSAYKDIESALEYLEKELLERSSYEPKVEPPVYFPEQVSGYLLSDMYSYDLWMFREPSLLSFVASPSYHAYRLLFFPPFDGPTCTRLEVNFDGSGLLTLKRAAGPGALHPWKLVVNETRPVSRHNIKRFLKHLARAAYWLAPLRDDSGVRVMDGSLWIFEGVKEQQYHIVQGGSSSKGLLTDAVHFFIRLSPQVYQPINKDFR
jgi:hypothetical protein